MKDRLLKVYLLGRLRLARPIDGAWQTVAQPLRQHRHVRALLGYLVSSPGRRRPREQVMDALWPELDGHTAANRLHGTVHRLRRLLEPHLARPATSHLLRVEADVLALADGDAIWVDVDAFEKLSSQSRTVNDPRLALRLAEEAVALYDGDFLQEERSLEWALARREVLQRSRTGLLLELSDRRAEQGSVALALEALTPLLTAEPANEAAVRRQVVLLNRLERRSEASQVYSRLVSARQERGTTTAWQVASPPHARRLAQAPARIGRLHQSPLVGRAEELARLRQVLLAVEGRRRLPQDIYCLLLQGEAGIGKTRLVEEVSREAQARQWRVAWSRAYEQEGDIPYRLWVDILRNLLASADAHLTRLLSAGASAPVARHHIYRLSLLVPELQHLLPYEQAPASQLADHDQLHLWAAMHYLLLRLSAGAPLLLVFDDLHWADDSSLKLLAYLSRQLQLQSPQRVLLLATSRARAGEPGCALHTLSASLQLEGALTLLDLRPLSASQIGDLLASLPAAVVQDIQAQAAGNPFFAEELARFSSNTGYADEAGEAASSSNRQLPETIAAALDRRMGKLSLSCQRLLGQASMLGGPFELDLLHAMGAGSSQEELLQLLSEALQAGLLTVERSGTRLLYHFWHPIIVSHLYAQMSAARRRLLHRKAAQAWRQLYRGREEEAAAVITQHLIKGAGSPRLTAHFAELAGNRAYALAAYPEAEHYFQLAIEQRALAPAAEEEQAEERRLLAFLLERLGECKMIRGDYGAAYLLYEKVLMQRSQYRPPHGAERRGEAQVQALLWYEMGRARGYAGHLQGVQYCNEQGAQVLRAAGITGGVAWACLRLQDGNKCYIEGRYDEAWQAAQEAVRLFEAERPRANLDSTASAVHSLASATRTLQAIEGDQSELGNGYEMLGIIAGTIGQVPVSLQHLHRALAIFEEQNNVRSIANVCNNIGSALMLTSELIAAGPFFQRSLQLAERVGDVPLEATVCVNLGELVALAGKLPEAEEWYRRGLLLAERLNVDSEICYASCILALHFLDAGKMSEAIAAVRRALAAGRATRHAPLIGMALITLACLRITLSAELCAQLPSSAGAQLISTRLRRIHGTLRRARARAGLRAEDTARANLARATLHVLQENWQEAQAIATQTLQSARQQHHIVFQLQSQRLLGIILLETGNHAAARAHLQQALSTSAEYAMRLEQARALYQLGVLVQRQRAPSAAPSQDGLHYLRSARELFGACQAAIDLARVERALASAP